MATINRVSYNKLVHSKWTAVAPRDREKHFIVTRVRDAGPGAPRYCVLEAVHSRREIEIDWHELKDPARWRIGWR